MILDFNEIKKEDVLIAGGKGANLGEMTSAKINVPSGFQSRFHVPKAL